MAKNGKKWSKLPKWPKIVKKWSKIAGLTLSGPDVLAWAPEWREGQSQEARRASSYKSGPGGAPRLLVSLIIPCHNILHSWPPHSWHSSWSNRSGLRQVSDWLENRSFHPTPLPYSSLLFIEIISIQEIWFLAKIKRMQIESPATNWWVLQMDERCSTVTVVNAVVHVKCLNANIC